MLSDLPYAFRSLVKSPGFTAAAVLTLALGLSVNALFFAIANDLFLRPLPADAPDRLVIIAQKSPVIGYQVPVSYPDAQDFRRMVEDDSAATSEMSRVFAGLMAYKEEVVNLSSTGRTSERTWVHAATDNYFSVLGVQPFLGRFFLPSEVQKPGSEAVIVLTHDAWTSRFGKDHSIIGQTVKLNGLPFTVIGIAPPGFFGASWATSLSGFVPATMLTRLLPGGENYALNRGNTSVFLMGRLKPGANLEQAQAAAEVAYNRIMRDNPGYYLADARAIVMRENNSRPSPYIAHHTPKIVLALSALALLVLLVAVANVAGLLYARAASRERELAIRSAVGASRFQLVRGLLAESTLLALAAGVVGTVASLWLSPLLSYIAPSSGAPPAPVEADWRPFVATGLTALLVGLATGILPALRASGIAPLAFLKEAAPSTRLHRHTLRSLLVIGQVALSCVILVCAALALRSLVLLTHLSPGYRTDNLVLASYDLDLQNYTADQGRSFHTRLLDQVRTLPGVETASITTNVPLDVRMSQLGGVMAEGETPPNGTIPPPVVYVFAEYSYLATLELHVEAGRDFTDHDRFGSPRVVIINQALAKQLFGDKDPVGRRITIQGDKPAEVIGVVGRIRYYNLTDDSRPLIIDGLAQNYRGKVTLVVRTTSSSVPLVDAIAKTVHQLDPALPLFDVQTLQQHMKKSPVGLMPYRLGAILAGAQGGIALLLAGAGVFGLIAFTVMRRTREIGIRMALGASRLDVILAVTRESVGLTLVGLAVGSLVSLGIARMLSGLLFGAGRFDGLIVSGVALLIFFAAALACWLPVRHATKVNPVEALRAD